MLESARKINISNMKIQASLVWGNDIDSEDDDGLIPGIDKPADENSVSALRSFL